MTKYYTLAIRQNHGGWKAEFGDYERQIVKEEMQEYRREVKARDMKIIVSGDTQSEIEAALASL